MKQSRRPVVVTQSGEPKGAVVDIAGYQKVRQATLLLRLVAQGEADVRENRTVAQQRVFKALRKRLARE
jgi:PHD/YefM family antitoxin component YafN of YafNO toxin-antitoxin module